MIFFFAGFDSVAIVMCFGSYELAVNKEIQNKLRSEVVESRRLNGGKVTYESLLKMNYMDQVISEVLRKWPPIPTADRVATQPYTIEPVNADEKPVNLKIGDVISIPIFGYHRDPKNFENPTKFDPERFSDENKSKIKPYTYMPFGLGPRNCIGSRFALLEIKALFYHLLLNFEIEPTKITTVPMKLSVKTFTPTPVGGFWFGLKRLKST
ncbi:hypothetical protein D910_06712 [Dendroctonus ponderosae]|nr:hypothetical protein D910_06712 [Dendroctonus ponderosae]